METGREQHLVIFGCGYIGGAVARRARSLGVSVTALTRNEAKAEALRAEGIETVVADLARDEWHRRIPRAPAWVLNCVSSGGGGVEGYQRSYRDGSASIVAWARRYGPVATAVYTSSTSVYPQGGGERVGETAETGGGERAAILLEAEQLWRDAGPAWHRWFILRLAGIYGPGRHYLMDQVRQGVVAGQGDHRLNLIHRDDAAAAILACFLAPEKVGSEVFNVADDAPARKTEVVQWLAGQLGVAPPTFSGEAGSRRPVTPDRWIENGRLKSRLGWTPVFPGYREGFGSFLSR
ncbi:MAG: NAD-dependent epimerase/dehydratase family protein [Verrucomicrobia bacterium]|nr:NAD-dependent epimerase/dehydratase family protein [Verrucomicrobiota bacterium]